MQLVKEILMAFVGSSARAYGIITLGHFRVLVVQWSGTEITAWGREASCEVALFGMRSKVP